MQKGRSKYLSIPSLIIDTILLFNAFLAAGYIRFDGKFPDPVFYYKLLVGWIVLWILIALYFKLYDLPRIIYLDKIVLRSMYALILFTLISSASLFFMTKYEFSRVFFALTIVLFSVMLIIWHIMLIVIFKAYRRKGNNFRTIAIVGFNEKVRHLINEVLLVPENGFKIRGVFASNIPNSNQYPFYIGKEDDLIAFIERDKVDELYISLPATKSHLISKLISFADNNMIRVHLLPNFSNYLFQKFTISYKNNIPILELRNEPLESLSNRILKRFFDVVFSLLVLVFICSWLFPILALLIKTTSKGPVFFSQMRSGKDDEPFKCLKFRSMTVNSHADSHQATKNDARVTAIGKILRKTSLDEFPQFFNVLIGNMSVVGPRPHMLKHTNEYKQLVHKYMVRHFAKPGITGWAQIRGFRGETKEVQDMKNRAEADIWYIENWNFFLDLKIIFLTVWQVLFKKEKKAY